MTSTGPIRPIPRRVSEVSRASAPGQDGGAYSQNISRLERSAEEITMAGSDIGEEIRKMNEMEKERSRQNSIQSSHHGDMSVVQPRPPRRMGSTSSYASNSVVDANNTARWGGYSPPAFITSPVGSVRSGGSWSHASAMRSASGTTSSRLAMVEPMQEGNPLNSPLAPSSVSLYSQEHQMSRQASQTSFSRRYDQIAGEIEDQLQTIPATPSPRPPGHDEYTVHDAPDRPRSTDTFREAQLAFKDFDGVHYDPDSEEYVLEDDGGNEVRRVSARTSSGSLLDAASLLRQPKGKERMSQYGAPPPGQNMVYYPAPVPRMLNMPKRLSQQPPPSVQAKRRSQMLQEMSKQNRESAPWIPSIAFDEDGTQTQPDVRSQRSGSQSTYSQDRNQPRGMLNERMSMHNPQNIPAQLRASMFFEQPSVTHDVEVTGESAVATLDSILAASATAPVNAFTNHPYVGDVRKSVYAPERQHKRKSTATLAKIPAEEEQETEQQKKIKKKRSSSIGNFFRRNSTGLERELKEEPKSRPASRGSMLDFNENGNKLRKRKSQMSMCSIGDEMQRVERSDRPDSEIMPVQRRTSMISGGLIAQAANDDFVRDQRIPSDSVPGTTKGKNKVLTEGQQIDADFAEAEDDSDIDLDDPIYAQPTTLLAELQVRKAKLKSRNRTAAKAYPGGMHSTLLQLDAVEAINSKKRQKQKVALAWEDPNSRAEAEARLEAEDEDVPLGMLFPSKDGLIARKMNDGRDWDRPLGLMAKREMEESEPLSSRRTRLNPNARPLRQASNMNLSQLHLAGQPAADEVDDEGETLGQRKARLRLREALDGAIKDVAPKDAERPHSTFTADVLDQFPELTLNDDGTKKQDRNKRLSGGLAPAAESQQEEETLGARRARLQRDREASGGHNAQDGQASRPTLQSRPSLANILSSNPAGRRPAMNRDQQVSQGTLLHTAGLQQAKSKQDLLAMNMRSISGQLDRPFVDAQPQVTTRPVGGLLAQEKSRPANGAFQPTQYHQSQGSPAFDPALPAGHRDFSIGLMGAQRSRPANGAFAGGAYSSFQSAGLQQPSMANNPYFASPTAGLGGYGNAMSMYVPQQQQQQHVNAPAFYALNAGMPGAATPSVYNVMTGTGTYAYNAQNGLGLADGPPLHPNQRAAIDRWRVSVAPS
ncbi:hypothetical protein DOTSEDRAFT_170469 [Dothistroma septosporum NZE10]|uniref:Uncharacterized protein n=1 Tax=Dothistroma septosporum (strain NZE10 / CBS 128990) TaxID=675120 RepID=N1PS00_DOTSN|nr:hypothetical protein DOTSEDRAFT_170469 [Dothistroma septosporum NZE10]